MNIWGSPNKQLVKINTTINNSDKVKLAEEFFQRILKILVLEDIKNEPKAVAELINKHFPDWRRVLNELQRYSATGQIDAGILINIFDRYGKFITNLDYNDYGWDGTFNGKLLPSSDYWFTISVVDQNNNVVTYKGHFSLVI